MATLNQLKRTGKRAYRRVGRGQGSSRGKQSGRGGKGQTARAGNKRRPELRDIIKKIPKRRGYGKNRGRTVVPHSEPIAISIARLEQLFEGGAEITRASFVEKGILTARSKSPIKIVGSENSGKKFKIVGISASASAKASIEKSGGSLESARTV